MMRRATANSFMVGLLIGHKETVETGSNFVFVRIMKNNPKGQECGKRCDRIGLPPLLFPYAFEVCTTSQRSRSDGG
jgi:hypothetical protein